jgi:hypothetical protein
MRFDTSSSTPKLTFKPARYLETDEFNSALEQGTSPAAIKAITMTVAQADGVKGAEGKATESDEFDEAPASTKTNNATAKVKAAEEDSSEPVKRASKKEDAPAPKKDVSKILDEWDDE